MKAKLLYLFLLVFTLTLFSSCISDPRKNCNHPKHWEWAKEHQNKNMKRRGL